MIQIKSLLKIHYDATTPMDDYNTGFYNGLEAVLCLMEKRQPEFKDVEKFKTLSELKGDHIRRAMNKCEGNRAKAADILGVSRASLYRKDYNEKETTELQSIGPCVEKDQSKCDQIS